MIPAQLFGRTSHASTRVIFGSYALNHGTPVLADRALGLLLDHGINHIDTAHSYGEAERWVGTWMDRHRDKFFLATKTGERRYQAALAELRQSMERLRTDTIDLWQMHFLTNPIAWKNAMSPGGCLEAFLEARQRGWVRYLGVTGHGLKAPAMHLKSLQRYDFDSVLFPYNYALLQNNRYAASVQVLLEACRQRSVAAQTIKSIARRAWGKDPHTHNTYFYEPLSKQADINLAVHWVLGEPGIFLITAGDLSLLPKVLKAVEAFTDRPSEAEMTRRAEKIALQPIWS